MSDVNNLQHPVNMATLRELEETVAAGIEDIMIDLIDTFTVDCRATFETLTQALAAGDIKLVEINAHALKSSSATFGAETLASLFANMEDAARKLERGRVTAMVLDVTQRIDEVEEVLLSERKRLERHRLT